MRHIEHGIPTGVTLNPVYFENQFFLRFNTFTVISNQLFTAQLAMAGNLPECLTACTTALCLGDTVRNVA